MMNEDKCQKLRATDKTGRRRYVSEAYEPFINSFINAGPACCCSRPCHTSINCCFSSLTWCHQGSTELSSIDPCADPVDCLHDYWDPQLLIGAANCRYEYPEVARANLYRS